MTADCGDPALQPGASPTPARPWGRTLLWVLPGVTALLLYAQVRDHMFIDLDDMTYTAENPMVARGISWEGIVWAFTKSYSANYHPLTWVSHMLDFTLFGVAPGAFALVNATIHALNACLVARLLGRLLRSPSLGIAAGCVFAIHPVLVEAVAWISQRKTVLSTCFALATLLLYLRATAAEVRVSVRPRPYLGAILCYACSLLSKGMYVTMPVILLVVEATMRARDGSPADATGSRAGSDALGSGWRGLTARIVPFAVLALAGSIATYLAQAADHAVQSIEAVPLSERLNTAVLGITSYIRHFFHPQGLSVFYPRPEEISYVATAGGALVLAAVTHAAWMARRWCGWTAFGGWLLFLVMLGPVVGLVQIGEQAFADRYMYGPILGLLVSAAALIAPILQTRARPVLRVALIGGFTLWLGAAGVSSHRQIGLWANSYSLATASIRAVGPTPQLLSLQGAILLRARSYAAALECFRQAIALEPTHLSSIRNAAVCEYALGDTEAAIRSCRQAIALAPEDGDAWANLGLYLSKAGRDDEARQAIGEARTRTRLSRSADRLCTAIEEELNRRAASPNPL